MTWFSFAFFASLYVYVAGVSWQ